MKIAVVTGASSGMGREFVRQISALYPDLDEIWVFARRQERMERLRDRCHTPLRIFAGNLLKKKICKEYGKALEDSRPDVRILVNAAVHLQVTVGAVLVDVAPDGLDLGQHVGHEGLTAEAGLHRHHQN